MNTYFLTQNVNFLISLEEGLEISEVERSLDFCSMLRKNIVFDYRSDVLIHKSIRY